MSAVPAPQENPVPAATVADGSHRMRGRVLVLGALLLVVAFGPGLLINMGRDLNPDEHQFIASAVLLARDGLLPYRDFPYFHVPNLTLAYAAIFRFTSHYLLAARLFSLTCGFLLLVTVLVFTMRRWRNERASVRLGMGALAVLFLALSPIFAYTSGRAWNHDLPILLTVWALLAQVHGLQGRRPWAWLFLAGLMVGLAAGTRASFLFVLPPFLLGAIVGGEGGLRGALLRAVTWCAGVLVAMTPVLALFVLSPGGFLFGNLEYTRLNTLYREAGGWATAMTLPGKVWLFLSQVLLTRPGNLLIALGWLAWGLPRPFPHLWRARVRWGRELRPFVLMLLPFLLLGALAPTPAWPQYFYLIFPFLWLAALDGLPERHPAWAHDRRFWYGAWGLVAVIALLWAISFRHNLRPAVLGRWFPLEYHQAGVDLATLLGAQTRVLTLAPTLPLEGGLDIYPELATGPFALRVADLVSPEERQRQNLPPVDDLEGWLANQPPRAVLLDVDRNDAADELPIAEIAREGEYIPLRLRDKSVIWMNPLVTWEPGIRLAALTRTPATQLAAGAQSALLLYLVASETPQTNLSRVLRLRAADGTLIDQVSEWPWGKPTSTWKPGEMWFDGATIAAPADAAPALYRLEVEFFDSEAGQSAPATAGSLGAVGETGYSAGYLTVGEWPGAPAQPVRNMVVFGDFARLSGASEPAVAGNTLTVSLYWQPQARTNTDYTVFAHLLNGAGELVAQQDKPPLDGFYPTSQWEPRLTFKDDFRLELKAPLPPGEYTLQVGLYDPATGARLPVTVDGVAAGDAYAAARVED